MTQVLQRYSFSKNHQNRDKWHTKEQEMQMFQRQTQLRTKHPLINEVKTNNASLLVFLPVCGATLGEGDRAGAGVGDGSSGDDD